MVQRMHAPTKAKALTSGAGALAQGRRLTAWAHPLGKAEELGILVLNLSVRLGSQVAAVAKAFGNT